MKKKVGIIGGGVAGLTLAWLLDEQCDVTLFEASPQLGGHSATRFIDIMNKHVAIEAGFEFFEPPLFPTFCTLLDILGISTHSYDLTYTFHSSHQNIILPPVRNRTLWLRMLISNVATYTQMANVLFWALNIVNARDTSITMETFINSLSLSQTFKNNFLWPFLASGWGVSTNEFKKFAAYDIMTWLIKDKLSLTLPAQWQEVAGGTTVYIQELARQCANTRILLKTPASTVTHQDNQYNIITDTSNPTFDHLVLATNCHEAAQILKNIPSAIDRVRLLERIEYFKTTIAIHGDPSVMPADQNMWSVVNVGFDGHESAMTVHKPWLSDAPLFRTWITHEPDKLLAPLYARDIFYHAKVTPEYFAVQHELQKKQGAENLWLAGVYTQGIDSHESAVCSAVAIAMQLAPQSNRLQLLSKAPHGARKS